MTEPARDEPARDDLAQPVPGAGGEPTPDQPAPAGEPAPAVPAAKDEPGDAAAEPVAEVVAEAVAARATGMAALTGEEFDFAEAVGGVRGLIESVLPGLVFVVVFVVTSQLSPALIASVVVTVAAVVVRLVQGSSVSQAASGAVGVAIGVVWAWRSGEASDYFVWGLLTNAAYLLGMLVSLLVRWPAIGLVVGALRGLGLSWRTDPALIRRYTWATWLWVGLFAVRLIVQLPLYLADAVGWLGTARIVMGVPLWALVLWLTWLLVRPAAEPATPEGRPADG